MFEMILLRLILKSIIIEALGKRLNIYSCFNSCVFRASQNMQSGRLRLQTHTVFELVLDWIYITHFHSRLQLIYRPLLGRGL